MPTFGEKLVSSAKQALEYSESGTNGRSAIRETDWIARDDYTEWQRGLFKDVPLDQFLRDADAYRKANRPQQ